MWQHLPKDIRLQIARDLSIDVYIALGVSPGKLQVPVYLSEALINAKSRLKLFADSSEIWFNVENDGCIGCKLLEYRRGTFLFFGWTPGSHGATSAWGSPDNTVYNKISLWT